MISLVCYQFVSFDLAVLERKVQSSKCSKSLFLVVHTDVGTATIRTGLLDTV